MDAEEYERIVKDVVARMGDCINQGVELEKERDLKNEKKEEGRIWLHLFSSIINSGTAPYLAGGMADESLLIYKDRFPTP